MVGLNISDLDLHVLKTNLINASVFPQSDEADVFLQAWEYHDGALDRNESELGVPLYARRSTRMGTHRHLLQDPAYGVHLKVLLLSEDALGMENTTSVVDVNGITSLLANWYNVAVNILEHPQNVVESVDNVYGAVQTVLTGFQVEGIVYNKTALEWLITVNYVPENPNTITSLYVTDAEEPPYSQDVLDTFYISKHPCMVTTSVCCLTDYQEDYWIGKFSDNITNSIGSCDANIQSNDTLGLFDPIGNNDLLLGALDGLQYSYVTRLSPTSLQLHLNHFALKNQVGVREPVAGGFNIQFFVGMSYYTLLPASALATVASQTKINVVSTDAVNFATLSSIDYTFIEYITFSLYQTLYVEDLLIEHKMQYVKVGFVVPASMKQNMDTGLVPMTSIRFAVSRDTPADLDDPAWINPCYSTDNTGLYDNSTSSLRRLYVEAEQETCSYQTDMCVNPLTETIPGGGYVEYWLPIGDDTISQAILDSVDEYNLFVYFDVHTVTTSGKTAITKLYAQASISDLSFARACEELSAAQTVADVVELNVMIGMVGLDKDWDMTITTFENVIDETANSNYEDTTLTVHAPSLQSGLITLAVRGNEGLFNNPLATTFTVEIEDLVTMHFLEVSKYNDMVALLDSGDCYELVRDESTGFLTTAFTPDALETCEESTIPGDFTCAVRRNIYRREVVWEYGVHPLHTNVSTNNETLDSLWIQEHLLGGSEFADEYARNFTRLVRQRNNINDRYNRAWYVNPSFQWGVDPAAPARSILSTQDKMIMIGVIVLEDNNWVYGDNGGLPSTRRMLLQVTADALNGVQATVRNLQGDGRIGNTPLPPFVNPAVDNDLQIATMKDVHTKRWVKAGLQTMVTAGAGYTKTEIRNELERRLNANMRDFLPGADGPLFLVQFLLKKDESTQREVGRRLLAPGDVVDWEGTLNVLITLAEGELGVVDQSVYYNWLRCALFLASIPHNGTGHPTPDCGNPAATNNETMGGFINSFWIQTCNNYSTTPGSCQDVLTVMQDPPQNTAPMFTTPVGFEAGSLPTRVGFIIVVYINDNRITTDTLTVNERFFIKSTLAQYLLVHPDWVINTAQNDINAARRLLTMSLTYSVRVPDLYDVEAIDLTLLEQQLKQAIETELGFRVDLSVIRGVIPDSELPPGSGDSDSDDNDDDASTRDTALLVLVIVIGSLLGFVMFGILFYNMCLRSDGYENLPQDDYYAQQTPMQAQVGFNTPNAGFVTPPRATPPTPSLFGNQRAMYAHKFM